MDTTDTPTDTPTAAELEDLDAADRAAAKDELARITQGCTAVVQALCGPPLFGERTVPHTRAAGRRAR